MPTPSTKERKSCIGAEVFFIRSFILLSLQLAASGLPKKLTLPEQRFAEVQAYSCLTVDVEVIQMIKNLNPSNSSHPVLVSFSTRFFSLIDHLRKELGIFLNTSKIIIFLKYKSIQNQKRSPRIFLANQMSLCMTVIL